MTKKTQDLLASYVRAIEREVLAAETRRMKKWTEAKSRRAEACARFIDHLERLEALIGEARTGGVK